MRLLLAGVGPPDTHTLAPISASRLRTRSHPITKAGVIPTLKKAAVEAKELFLQAQAQRQASSSATAASSASASAASSSSSAATAADLPDPLYLLLQRVRNLAKQDECLAHLSDDVVVSMVEAELDAVLLIDAVPAKATVRPHPRHPPP